MTKFCCSSVSSRMSLFGEESVDNRFEHPRFCSTMANDPRERTRVHPKAHGVRSSSCEDLDRREA